MVPPANHWVLGSHKFILPLYFLRFRVHFFLYSIFRTPQFHKASNLPFDYRVVHVQDCQRLRGIVTH